MHSISTKGGQIVGLGAVDHEGRTHAFLMTQVMLEPPVWLLMGPGVVGVALRRLGWRPARGRRRFDGPRRQARRLVKSDARARPPGRALV
jgi:hypothetical protein